MLANGFNHFDELNKKLNEVWYDTKYMFYFDGTYRNPITTNNNDGDWSRRYFVSLDEKTGEVLGYITYCVDHEANYATGFGAINLSDNMLTFGKDLAQVIDDIFCKFNHNKINWCVVVGNPIEKSYDKYCKRYGGHIVGYKKQHVRLMDGKLYDHKEYELFRDEYLQHRRPYHVKKNRT